MSCGSGDAGRRVSGIDAEQSVEHIIRRIAGTTRSQKTVNPGRVVARRDERRLELTAVTDLGVSNSGQEAACSTPTAPPRNAQLLPSGRSLTKVDSLFLDNAPSHGRFLPLQKSVDRSPNGCAILDGSNRCNLQLL
jgi:hypothetical protein